MTQEETLDPQDWAALRALGHRALDDAMDYMQSLRDRPAWEHAPARVKAHFDGPPPAEPQPIEDIYREYVEYVLPYQLGNSHPRFWGWVLGSGTPMGVLAEMLAAATDSVSGIYSYVSNNYVELQVLDWCKEMLGYPLSAGGLLTSGCSASNLIALAVARNARAGFDVRREGLAGAPVGTGGAPQRLTVYCSAEAHSSLTKAVELTGPGHELAAARAHGRPSAHRPRGPRRDDRARPRGRAAPHLRRRGRRDHQHGVDRRPAGPRRLVRARGPLVPRGRRLRRLGRHRSRLAAPGRRHGARRLARLRPAQVDEPGLPRRLRAGPRRRGPAADLLADALVPRPRRGRARADRGGRALALRLRVRTFARLPRAQGVDGAQGARRRQVRARDPAEHRPGEVPGRPGRGRPRARAGAAGGAQHRLLPLRAPGLG